MCERKRERENVRVYVCVYVWVQDVIIVRRCWRKNGLLKRNAFCYSHQEDPGGRFYSVRNSGELSILLRLQRIREFNIDQSILPDKRLSFKNEIGQTISSNDSESMGRETECLLHVALSGRIKIFWDMSNTRL